MSSGTSSTKAGGTDDFDGWYTKPDPYGKSDEKFFVDFHEENLTQTKIEDGELFYRNKLNGQEYKFFPSDNIFVAAFSPKFSQQIEQRMHKLVASEMLNIDHQRGFARLVVKAPHYSMVGAFDEIGNIHDSVSVMPAMRRMITLNVEPKKGEMKEVKKIVTNHFIPGQFLLQLTDEKSMQKQVLEKSKDLLTKWGLKVLIHQKTPGFFTLAIPQNMGLFQTLRTFSSDSYSEIKFVEPCETAYNEGDYSPSDYYYVNNGQWGINGELAGGVNAVYDFHVYEAWNIESAVYDNTGVSNAVCAILDTGIYKSGSGANHSELSGQIVGEQSFGYPDVKDNDGHGTALAGVVVAKQHSTGYRIIGVAPTGKIYVIKYRNDYSTVALENLYNAIKWVGTGTNVTFTNPYNNTTYTYSGLATTYPGKRYVMLLCTSYADTFPPSMDNAIIEAVDNKVLVICSAGNNNSSTLGSPSLLAPIVLPVGAVDDDGVRYSQSNYGSSVIAAPGVAIRTADNGGFSSAILSGTSIAAAFIAGEALLMYHRDRADGDWDACSSFNSATVNNAGKIAYKIRNNLSSVTNSNFLGVADCNAAVGDVP